VHERPERGRARRMTDEIDPRVEARIWDNSAPKLKSNWMMSLPVIAKPKTWVYTIQTIEGHEKLGKVLWKNRTYIFIPDNDPRYEIEFYASCLQSIVNFIKALMEERKNIRKVEESKDEP